MKTRRKKKEREKRKKEVKMARRSKVETMSNQSKSIAKRIQMNARLGLKSKAWVQMVLTLEPLLLENLREVELPLMVIQTSLIQRTIQFGSNNTRTNIHVIRSL